MKPTTHHNRPNCHKTTNRKIFIFIFSLALSLQLVQAQGQLTTVNDGNNKKASVSEHIGLAKVTINYDRPGVKGREGKIWNTDVAHYGLKDLGYGTSKSAPWRAGANENTTVTFSEAVKIEGHDMAAGTYGFHIILGETDDTLIFSKRNNSWGSFYYEPSEDAIRIVVRHRILDKNVEWLKYEFIDQTENSATVALMWEKRLIPFKVEADIHKLQLASFKSELKNKPGFNWLPYIQGARYCVDNNLDLEQAMVWADQAISERYVGQKNFQTLSTKAEILSKMGKNAEAEKLMAEAITKGTVIDLHQYARKLIGEKKAKEALAVFQLNYKNNPDVFTTNVGLARGYSNTGNYKKAMPYLEKAINQAPDAPNKEYLESLRKKLEKGADIN
jgi:tetratricopeptide (TPR) repeat protein